MGGLVEAVNLTLESLDESGREAEFAAVRLLAEQLDASPHDTDLWREFRLGLKALREVSGDSDVDESIRDLLGRLGGADIRDAAEG